MTTRTSQHFSVLARVRCGEQRSGRTRSGGLGSDLRESPKFCDTIPSRIRVEERTCRKMFSFCDKFCDMRQPPWRFRPGMNPC